MTKEERREYLREYMRNNPEARAKKSAYMKGYLSRWREVNRESYNAYQREYRRKKYAETQGRSSKEYYRKNREKIIEYKRGRRAAQPGTGSSLSPAQQRVVEIRVYQLHLDRSQRLMQLDEREKQYQRQRRELIMWGRRTELIELERAWWASK